MDFAASCDFSSGVAFTFNPQRLQRVTWLAQPSGMVGMKNKVSQRRTSTAVCTVGRAHFVHARSTCPTAFALVRTPIRKNMLLLPKPDLGLTPIPEREFNIGSGGMQRYLGNVGWAPACSVWSAKQKQVPHVRFANIRNDICAASQKPHVSSARRGAYGFILLTCCFDLAGALGLGFLAALFVAEGGEFSAQALEFGVEFAMCRFCAF